MKKWIVIAVAALIAGSAAHAAGQQTAQDRRAARKAERLQKKQERDSLDMLAWRLAVQALEANEFVLEADQIISKYGRSAHVSSETNFVSRDGRDATVQVAFNVAASGLNGLGGITVDGQVTSSEIEKRKKGDITYTMYVSGIAISAQVIIQLPKGSNRARVTITPNLNGNRVMMQGVLVPAAASTVFKGSSI